MEYVVGREYKRYIEGTSKLRQILILSVSESTVKYKVISLNSVDAGNTLACTPETLDACLYVLVRDKPKRNLPTWF